jgi:hypothetical protein
MKAANFMASGSLDQAEHSFRQATDTESEYDVPLFNLTLLARAATCHQWQGRSRPFGPPQADS